MIVTTYTSANAQLEKVTSHYKALEKHSKDESVTIQFVQEEDNLVENYSQLSQIILIRHGEPALNKKGWRKRREAMAFIVSYDSAHVYPPSFNPIRLHGNEADTVYTSTLRRSISTAEQLFQETRHIQSEAIFREFERKIIAFPNIKLPLKGWLATSRICWFMGLNKRGIESIGEAKKRAKKGTDLLGTKALENGKVLLVSHGLLNHYLAKYLRKKGWTETYDGGKGYLSQKMFVKYL